MTRQTPLPLLRYLTPNTLVARCVLCHELTLANELCQSEQEAYSCPRRATVDSQLTPDAAMRPTLLALPLATIRNLNA